MGPVHACLEVNVVILVYSLEVIEYIYIFFDEFKFFENWQNQKFNISASLGSPEKFKYSFSTFLLS